jgi:precorrin-6A/cobalt-precorrin-6A reductase
MHSIATPRGAVLILGGTAEARQLAALLTDQGLRVVSSLAGRVSAPRRPAGEVRTGGFGGVEGLAAYLDDHEIAAVVDATHPFAARITANAVAAGRRTGTPLLVVRRPPWTAGDGDTWHPVPDLAAAASTIGSLTGPDGRVLLTTGRQETAAFSTLPQRFWLRAVEPPDGPLPARCEVVLARGPFALDGERSLLRDLGIDVLVTKNSGGPMTGAKLTAARELRLPVIMVERPALPSGIITVDDARSALAWVTRHRAQ